MCEIITLENLLTLISHFNTDAEYSPSVLALCILFRIPTDETVERGKPLSFITFCLSAVSHPCTKSLLFYLDLHYNEEMVFVL